MPTLSPEVLSLFKITYLNFKGTIKQITNQASENSGSMVTNLPVGMAIQGSLSVMVDLTFLSR